MLGLGLQEPVTPGIFTLISFFIHFMFRIASGGSTSRNDALGLLRGEPVNRFAQVVRRPRCGWAPLLLIAAVLTGLGSTAVFATTSIPTEMSSILTSADNGRTIELHVGGEAALRLPENPSTGYRWAVDAADPNLVQIEERGRLATSDKIGAGGEAQWLIKAIAPGATEIKLKRWRQWEGERSVVERFEIKLRVAP